MVILIVLRLQLGEVIYLAIRIMDSNKFYLRVEEIRGWFFLGFISRSEFVWKGIDLVTEYFGGFCPIERLEEFMEVLFHVERLELMSELGK